MPFLPCVVLLLACICGVPPTAAQLSPGVQAAISVTAAYEIRPNLVYDTRGGVPLRLDAYVPVGATKPRRTLV